MTKTIFFILTSLFLSSAFSYEVREYRDTLLIDCRSDQESNNECQKLCEANQCELASLTCETCARSSDSMFVSILKRFHRIYDDNKITYTPSDLKPFLAKNTLVAIGHNSPLNIFADPFSKEDSDELNESFNKVCGFSGSHYVLALQGKDSIEPKAIICGAIIHGLTYRADYYSETSKLIYRVSRP